MCSWSINCRYGNIVATANIPDTIVKGTPFYVVVKADGTAEITETKPTDAKAKELKWF